MGVIAPGQHILGMKLCCLCQEWILDQRRESIQLSIPINQPKGQRPILHERPWLVGIEYTDSGGANSPVTPTLPMIKREEVSSANEDEAYDQGDR